MKNILEYDIDRLIAVIPEKHEFIQRFLKRQLSNTQMIMSNKNVILHK